MMLARLAKVIDRRPIGLVKLARNLQNFRNGYTEVSIRNERLETAQKQALHLNIVTQNLIDPAAICNVHHDFKAHRFAMPINQLVL